MPGAMSWLGRILGRKGAADSREELELRATRFRQLLRCYGALLTLIEDAAAKQGGDFVLDKQYIVSLTEQAFDLAESVLFDANVMTDQHLLGFFPRLDALHTEMRRLIARPLSDAGDGTAGASATAAPAHHRVSAEALAAALERAEKLTQREGDVACRGIAAGVVRKQPAGDGRRPPASGYVLVAADAGEEVLSLVAGAEAVLLDRGSTSDALASAVRARHVPTIVGLGDLSERVEEGAVLTVDADEGVVYRERVEELLEYYQSERLGGDEEPEYRLLRTVRRALFPLTLPEAGAARVQGCTTLHDLVFLAHLEAGRALATLAANDAEGGRAWRQVDGMGGPPVRVADLGGGARGAEGDAAQTVRAGDLECRPLRVFLDGFAAADGTGGDILALITEEHANVTVRLGDGAVALDAMIGGGDMGYLYCRLEPGGGEGVPTLLAAGRGRLVRLGLPAVLAGSVVVAWQRGASGVAAETTLDGLGRLAAGLAHLARMRVTELEEADGLLARCMEAEPRGGRRIDGH